MCKWGLVHKGAQSYRPMVILSPHLPLHFPPLFSPFPPHSPPFFLGSFHPCNPPIALLPIESTSCDLFSFKIPTFQSSIQKFPHFPPFFLISPFWE